MKNVVILGEGLFGILIDLLTIPFLLLGFVVGLRGSVRYFRMKFM